MMQQTGELGKEITLPQLHERDQSCKKLSWSAWWSAASAEFKGLLQWLLKHGMGSSHHLASEVLSVAVTPSCCQLPARLTKTSLESAEPPFLSHQVGNVPVCPWVVETVKMLLVDHVASNNAEILYLIFGIQGSKFTISRTTWKRVASYIWSWQRCVICWTHWWWRWGLVGFAL